MDVQAAVQEALPVMASATVEDAARDELQQQESSDGPESAAAQTAASAEVSAQVLPAAEGPALEELQQQESSGGPASAVSQQAVPAEASAARLPAAEDSPCHARELSAASKPALALFNLPLELSDPQEVPGQSAVAWPLLHAAVAEPVTPEPVQASAAASSEPPSPQGEARSAAAAWPLAQQAAMPEPVQALTAAPAEPASPPTLQHSSSAAARLLEQQAAVARPATPELEQALLVMSPPDLSPQTLEQDFAAASADSEGLDGAQEVVVAAADEGDAADQQTPDASALPPAEAAAHAEQQGFSDSLLEEVGQVLEPVPGSSSGAASQLRRQTVMRSSGSGGEPVVPVPAAAAEAGSCSESVHLRPSAAAAAPVGEASMPTKPDFHVVCTLAARLRLERRLAEQALSQAEEVEEVQPRASSAGRQ